MLEVLVRNAHGALSPRDREYAEKKLGRLGRYFASASRVEIAYSEDKQGHRVDVTVFADGLVLHGTEVDGAAHAAIDKVSDKLEQRLRRAKSKLVKAYRRRGEEIPVGLEELGSGEEPEMGEDADHLVEHRVYSAKPMGLEEAVLQLELSDLPFVVFRNGKGEVEVVYRRERGGLGILSPE